MILDQWLLPDISLIVLNYLGKYKKDYDLNYLLCNDLCILFEGVDGNGDFKNCDTRTANICAAKNQPGILKQLENKGIFPDTRGINLVATAGDLEMLKYLESKGLKCGYRGIINAIYHNHLHILTHLSPINKKYLCQSVMINAIRNGNINIVEFLKNEGYDVILYGCYAMECKNIEMIKYFEKMGYKYTNEDLATGPVTIEALKYLDSKGITIPNRIIHDECHDMKMIEYLESRGFKCSQSTLTNVSELGDVETIKYLEKQGLICDSKCVERAIFRLNIDVLKYFKEKKIIYNSGFTPIVSYIEIDHLIYLENNYDIKYNNNIINSVTGYTNMEIFEYLESKGLRCTQEGIDNAATHGNIEIVKYLEKQGLKCSNKVMEIVIEDGYVEMQKYLESQNI